MNVKEALYFIETKYLVIVLYILDPITLLSFNTTFTEIRIKIDLKAITFFGFFQS